MRPLMHWVDIAGRVSGDVARSGGGARPGGWQLALDIAAQPVHTIGDILDRCIVLAWGRGDVPMDDILGPVRALGGIDFAQCDEHALAAVVA